jgi:hypothetical protein
MVDKPRKGARKLVVDGRPWWFKVGQATVEIWDSSNHKSAVDINELTGRSWDVLERGRWKGTLDGMVKPSDVVRYIQAELS